MNGFAMTFKPRLRVTEGGHGAVHPLGGALTILSPCILPVPFVFAHATADGRGIVTGERLYQLVRRRDATAKVVFKVQLLNDHLDVRESVKRYRSYQDGRSSVGTQRTV